MDVRQGRLGASRDERTILEEDRDHPPDLAHDDVVGRLGERLVEGEVRGSPGFPIGGVAHRIEVVAKRCQVVGGGTFGGEAGHQRFQQHPHLDQILQHAAIGQHQEHLRVGHRAGLDRSDIGPFAAPNFEQPHRFQTADRLAHRGATDAGQLDQLRLRRQARTRLQFATADQGQDRFAHHVTRGGALNWPNRPDHASLRAAAEIGSTAEIHSRRESRQPDR